MNLQKVIETIADERSIDEERVSDIIEKAFVEAANKKYGQGYNFEAEYDDGMTLRQKFVAKKNATDPYNEIPVSFGNWREGDELVFQVYLENPQKQKQLQKEYGDVVNIPSIGEDDFDRIAINHARELLSRELDQINKERAHDLYKDQIGEIVSGRVRYISDYNVAVDLGKTKAVLPQNQTLPDENFDEGENVTAVIKDVNPPTEGEQIILSRTDPQFVAAMFEEDVEEIRNGRIEIKDVVREAGFKTKISVMSQERGLSSVGPCIGKGGSRVMNISNKLGGERIDVVSYTSNLETYAENALGDSITVLYTEENEDAIKVKVPEEDMGLAIGKHGRNVRLASKLIGKEIDLQSMSVG